MEASSDFVGALLGDVQTPVQNRIWAGRFADREVTLNHELISISKFDIGKVSLRPCDYFSVVRISNALLCEPHSAVQNRIWAV